MYTGLYKSSPVIIALFNSVSFLHVLIKYCTNSKEVETRELAPHMVHNLKGKDTYRYKSKVGMNNLT